MSWEDEDFDFDAVPTVPGATGGGVAASWEDIEEGVEDLGIGGKPAASGPATKKQPASNKPKHMAKKKREEIEKREQRGNKIDLDTPLDDPEEERKRQEYLQRQSELELAEDTFGANDDGVEIEEDDMVKAINNIPLSSAQAHETAATKLAERLFSTGTENTPDARRKAARSKLNGMRFIQQLLRSSFDHISIEDLNDLSTVITTAKNAKLKAEQDKSKKKKKNKKAPNVQNERDIIKNEGDDELGDEYADFMF